MSDAPLTDPREIRKLLQEIAYRGSRIDRKESGEYAISMTGNITRHVMQMAEIQGYSGEDTMAMLAYYALLQYESAMDRLLDMVNTSPAPNLVIPIGQWKAEQLKKEGHE